MIKQIVFILSFVLSVQTFATPRDVVSLFGQYLSSWCNTDDVQYRDKIERLCSGVKSCRVEDKIHADYQRNRGYMDYETYFLDSYLNMFQTLIPSGVKYSLSNIVVETQDQYPDGQVLTFITADVKVSGKINQIAKDLFLVRDNKISGIYHYSSVYGFKHLHSQLINLLNQGKYTFADARSFYDNGILLLKDKSNKYGIINIMGEILIPFKWNYIVYYGCEFAACIANENEEASIYDIRNGKLTPFSHGYRGMYRLPEFTNGYAAVQDKRTKMWGYLRIDDLSYSEVNYNFDYPPAMFDDYGYALVTEFGNNKVIDKNFRTVASDNDKYVVVGDIGENLILVESRSTRKIGIIDLGWNFLVPCKYDTISKIKEGMIKVRKNGKFGFININGDEVISCVYDEEDLGSIVSDIGNPYNFHNGYCLVGNVDIPSADTYGISHGFINKEGTIVLPYNYTYSSDPFIDHIEYSKYWKKYYTKITRNDGKQSFIDLTGKPIRGFSWYDELSYEQNELIEYNLSGKYGFLNTEGEVYIPPISDSHISFEDGYADITQKKNGLEKHGLMNTNGTIVIPCEYDNVITVYNGIALIQRNGVLGILDLYGNEFYFQHDDR